MGVSFDGRKLTHEACEQIRRVAVRRVLAGEHPSEVIRSYGMYRTSIYKWIRAFQKKGHKALKSRKGTGRLQTLNKGQKMQIRSWICGKDPRHYEFEVGLWTRKIIADLIEEKLNMQISIITVGRILKELKITPQKPLRRAYERDPKAIKQWKENEYPKIRKRAKKRKAHIFFLDEAGVRSDDQLGRTWGRKGQTPIVKITGHRQSVNIVSAVSTKGAFWYMVYTDRLNAERFIEFLRAFLRRRGKVILIIDGHPSHRANKVKEYVKSTKGRLELYFLPPYAPDLNPDEFVWNRIKKNGIAKKPLKQKESLIERVEVDMEAIKSKPSLIRSFFLAKSVSYIMN